MATSEYIQIVSVLIASFLSLIVGIIIERKRSKNSLKLERLKRLAPQLEICCPIVDKIYEDSLYTVRILERGENLDSNFDSQIDKVHIGLQQFLDWHSVFEQKGMKYTLESFDTEAHDWLTGLSTYASLANKHGKDYISTNLKEINKSSKMIADKLRTILKI